MTKEKNLKHCQNKILEYESSIMRALIQIKKEGASIPNIEEITHSTLEHINAVLLTSQVNSDTFIEHVKEISWLNEKLKDRIKYLVYGD